MIKLLGTLGSAPPTATKDVFRALVDQLVEQHQIELSEVRSQAQRYHDESQCQETHGDP